jgi:hypothetical protein
LRQVECSLGCGHRFAQLAYPAARQTIGALGGLDFLHGPSHRRTPRRFGLLGRCKGGIAPGAQSCAAEDRKNKAGPKEAPIVAVGNRDRPAECKGGIQLRLCDPNGCNCGCISPFGGADIGPVARELALASVTACPAALTVRFWARPRDQIVQLSIVHVRPPPHKRYIRGLWASPFNKAFTKRDCWRYIVRTNTAAGGKQEQ